MASRRDVTSNYTRLVRAHLEQRLLDLARGVEAEGHVPHVRLFQGQAAGGARVALPEVLVRARLAEQVAAARTEAGTVRLLERIWMAGAAGDHGGLVRDREDF